MRPVRYQPVRSRGRFVWCGAVVLVTGLHALLAAVLLSKAPAATADGGSPVVLLELAPVTQAQRQPEAATDAQLPPTETAPETITTARNSPTEPERETVPEPLTDLPSDLQAKIDDQPKAEEQPPNQAPVPVPALPTNAAAVDADRSASPAPGNSEAPNARQMDAWQRSLVARIEKAKRYPAQARGSQGIARVAFVIDREGQLITAAVVESSGSSILDAEAVDMLRRAAPFPQPPLRSSEQTMSFTLPVKFFRQ